MQGGAETALPEIESRLQEVRAWWQRHRAGEPVPEAPDPALLARALISGLDIARAANLALERWEACLGVLTESEETMRALGEGEHTLARTRFNRYGPLLRLGRLEEAQRVLESCLVVFRGAGDLPNESKALSALADLWDERGDPEQAAGLERQALAVRNRLSDLEYRSISHGNLANYLDRLGAAEEAARHRLAAIVYDLVTGLGSASATDLRNLAIDMRRAAASGECYELPGSPSCWRALNSSRSSGRSRIGTWGWMSFRRRSISGWSVVRRVVEGEGGGPEHGTAGGPAEGVKE